MLLQMGFPGGVEILVMMLMALLLFGIPLALVVVVGALWLRSDDEDYEQRIAELEADVARLQAELSNDDSTDADEEG